jgi:hypothetical protein
MLVGLLLLLLPAPDYRATEPVVDMATAPETQLRKLDGRRALFRVVINSTEEERKGWVACDVKGNDWARNAYSVMLRGEARAHTFLVRGRLSIVRQRNDIVGPYDEFRVYAD